jgi:molybdopterin synthase sulfur carrier subunit|tara:strand:+ start:35459 stop:35713 length:255 start_codon:yes stop_codon:yes gene_type:complete
VTVKVLLFGRLSELGSESNIELELAGTGSTPETVRTKLGVDNSALGKALNEPQILVALNKEIVSLDHPLKDGDELAFLPPVTGG